MILIYVIILIFEGDDLMAFDGIVTKAIVTELSDSIIESKIDKIYEPNKNTIILSLYSQGKHFSLNICIDSRNCRIHLTTHSRPNPLTPPNFCMLLRKHLIGGRISDIHMLGLERLVQIKIETINEFNEIEVKTLVI
jgi:predicted ribosome quality control (RQC) complex YloA/Tae2 family protein